MKRLSKILGLCFALILSISLVHAIEPSQQFNKILLNPFYRQSMDAQAYDYNITIDPPDGFEEVVSAIVTYQMWLNPTVEFFLSVNGQTCNTPSYEVHTSYAGAGEGTIFFDCTNIINHAGQYNITLTPDDDTGAVTGWLDITYQNNQSDYIETVGNVDTVGNVAEVGKLTEPEMDIHGTEYTSGQNAKVFLQLLDGDNQPIENSSCYTSIYYPTNQVWKYQQLMTYVDEGIFAYDFTTPQVQGVYPVSAFCTLPTYEQNSTEVYDTFEGDDGWAGAWDYDGCSVQSTYSYSSPSALECINDKFPERDITSSDAYARVDYSFWYRATGFSSSAYIFYQLIDASGTVYYLEVVTDGQDDGTWRRVTGSLSSDTDGFDFDGTITFKIDTNNDLDGNDYYYLDSLELSFAEEIAVNGTEYQIVRGSSEVHVTSDVEYEPVISYGTLTNETFDGYFYLYYDVYSGTNQNKTGQKVQLPIFNAFPCEEVQDVFLKNESGEWENISYSKRLLGNRNDRCSVNVEMDLAVAESYEIMIKLTNFWRLELLGRFDEATINKNIINDGCSVQSTYYYSSPSALGCNNDKFPERDITSSDAYARVDYSFWYRATGFSSSAYIFYQLIDASGTVYYLEVVTDGQDDGTWRRVTGSLSSDADGFDFDGTITFKIDTNSDLDGNDDYYLDSLELSFAEEIAVNGTEYQIVRGSSEVHVTSDVEYEPVISYGTLTNETFDGYFYLYYDVYSGTNQNKTGQKVQLPIFNAFPCEEVQDVFLKNESGEWENISYSKRLLGNRNDRCSVNVEMDLAVAESYEIMIKLTNFWRLELLGRFDEATINKNIINDGCVYYQMANGLDNFTVPLMSAPSETDDFWLSCQYYFQTYYDLNKTIVEKFVLQVGEANYTEEQMGELEGIYLNLLQQADLLNDLMKGILNNWQQGNDYSQTIIGGGSDIEYLTFFANISGNQMNYNAMQNLPAIVVGDMWEAENRTLTASRSLWVGGTEYSPDEEVGKVVVRLVDGTDSPVDDANCTIRIFYPDNTPYIYDAQMTNYVPPGNETGAGGIYLFDFNLSSIPGVYPYGIDCHITSGPSPKHYYILDTFHVFGSNRTKTAEAVWEYGTRTLTNATNIAPDIWGGNYTVSPSILGQLAASTWDYVARYVHGEII